MDERHKEKNIHFIGASEKVDMMKLVEMAISDIRQCQKYNFMGLWQNLTTLTKLNVLNHECVKLIPPGTDLSHLMLFIRRNVL